MSSIWPSSKARKVYAALLRIGWEPKQRAKGGSHLQMVHPSYTEEFTWAFHDSVEIGPKMLARIAKKTGLTPQDL
jgi:predicted RNA binding protein YcfA (HicA-like mRNA interferase family)